MLVLGYYGDYEKALCLLNNETWHVEEPLIKGLSERLWHRDTVVSVRYWISDVPLTENELLVNTVMQQLGSPEIKFYSHYSEITGYLWTDENFVVGGHDIQEELRASLGKWLYLKIVYTDIK